MNHNGPVYLTHEGFQALEKELEHLTTVRRQAVANRLHNALGEGELIENAELEEARRDQAFVEGRILEIGDLLRKAKIIEKDANNHEEVVLGSRVIVRERGYDDTETYLVVGYAEADPRKGKISNESPLGQVLLGKHKGDKAKVKAPDGDIVFEIISIE